MSESEKVDFVPIVLAGQRKPDDPLVRHAGASCKASVEIGGKPLISRVLNALGSAALAGRVTLCGPGREHLAGMPDVNAMVTSGEIDWIGPQPSPSTSAYHAMQTVPPEQAVLLTTSDLPFLSGEIVDRFCQESLALSGDVAVGLAPYPLVREAFPDMKKTVMRFRDGEYCGCNLFAFMTPDGRRVADFWRTIEAERKSPVKVARILGVTSVMRYLAGRLTLDDALRILSKRLGVNIRVVKLPIPEAAVDVDSVSDYRVVQRLFSAPGEAPQAVV